MGFRRERHDAYNYDWLIKQIMIINDGLIECDFQETRHRAAYNYDWLINVGLIKRSIWQSLRDMHDVYNYDWLIIMAS